MPPGHEALHDPARLQAVRETGLLGTPPDESFDLFTRLASRILETPVAMVNLIDDRRQFSKSRVAPPDWREEGEASLTHSLCKHVVLSGEALRIEDAEASPLISSRESDSRPYIRSYLGVPLRSPEGYVLGTLCVADRIPRSWSDAQVETLQDLATAAMSEVSLRREVLSRKRVEEALRIAQEEAVKANRSKSDFISRISHELRTPMNAILGFAQLLEIDVVRQEDRESVEQVLKAGRHLLALIDEVLDIARIESGRLGLAIEPVSVVELFREGVELTRRGAGLEDHVVRMQVTPGPEPFVWADPHRLKQVLLNLLSNAIKYNRPGGTVDLSYEAAGNGRLRISVRDTGPGIPAEELSRLFTPFERLGAERSGVRGAGLGLVVSKALVDAMGGTLGAESVVGEGSVFWVDLPHPDPEQIAPGRPRPEGGESDPVSPARTVLLVEDNLANARLIGHVLARRGGVRLIAAMQGRRALDLAREHRPDLVILDVNLPDIPGDEVLLHFRSDPLLQDVPVVMISGGADASQVDELVTLGARAFLRKPFEIHELLRVVEDGLQRVES